MRRDADFARRHHAQRVLESLELGQAAGQRLDQAVGQHLVGGILGDVGERQDHDHAGARPPRRDGSARAGGSRTPASHGHAGPPLAAGDGHRRAAGRRRGLVFPPPAATSASRRRTARAPSRKSCARSRGRGVAPARALGQAARDDGDHGGRDVLSHARRSARGSSSRIDDIVCTAESRAKRAPARQHLVEDRAERKLIRLRASAG